ncbi:helix-turn-helix domain-containing protein [Microbacterium sp. 1P10UB]|uniref:helix-turn-helix domain-containing protein n=1 Tax=unclassified Microbacterium TaxID=2609290 RepID=UPI0039A31CB4
MSNVVRESEGARQADRDGVFFALTSVDPLVRRDAFETAVDNRWLRRGQDTIVRVVLIDSAVSVLRRARFGRRLTALRPGVVQLAGLRSGAVILVGHAGGADLDARIHGEAEARGIRILGIGTASPSPTAPDLERAVAEATHAAELSAAFEEFRPAVDSSDLGGWLLLATARLDPASLAAVSPAAHALVTRGDEIQRRTVETYLDVAGNVPAACEVLFIHRTTLYYRLERMPAEVREALADGMKRSTLHLALKLIRLWEAGGRI